MDGTINNKKSMRVLVRPPIPPSTPPTPTSPLPRPPPAPPDQPPSSPSSTPPSGVVVVGFIGKRSHDVTYLLNRVLDANVFGSGNLDRPFRIEKQEEISEEMKNWFECRNISYYHDEEKCILYLQYSWSRCPVMEGRLESLMGFDSVLEDYEYGDLQGLLFMFSVCHVIIFIQEGSRFDTQILQKFRVLQAAKLAMAPFAKLQATASSTSGLHPSSARTSASRASPNNPSPIRSSSILTRNASAITLMSGLGSYTSLLPGQCTPVTLFIFLDDFTEVNPSSSAEEPIETSSLGSAVPTSSAKGSGSVVVLARPASKSEGGFRKKLQSSLEAQIRFSIKKCRSLSGSETAHAGSRSGTISSSAPLFSLDASKAVALVELSSNWKGESLEFATSLLEDILSGKSTLDSLLLERHSQSANKEDILSVREFIGRQSDILRGKGGIVSNANSGSAVGVGMVAVAAAAAAASAASGKTYATPELPSLGIWLSSSELILLGILSAKRGCISEPEISKRKSRQRNVVSSHIEGNMQKVTDPFEIAVSYLESARNLNTKFSTFWCQKALPVAREIYLKGLPPSYPTSQHKAHLERAMRAFNSMVKGPAVQLYMKKLEDECTSIWTSGRQLCDAVSLTGKPCMHQRHEIETGYLHSADEARPHCSGYVFLHACACGRSRRLCSDPFDFETANITLNHFPECDKLLPAIQLPRGSDVGPIQPSSWSLVRVGGARYYQPSKGLLQSGFSSAEKFLLKWTIFLEKPRKMNASLLSEPQKDYVNRLKGSAKNEVIVDSSKKKTDPSQLQGEVENGVEIRKMSSSENIKAADKTLNSDKGISNFTMRKPFSEVVAGSATGRSGFPPLQSRRQLAPIAEKGAKGDGAGEKVNEIAHNQISEEVSGKSTVDNSVNESTVGVDGLSDGNPFLQIGTNVVPVKVNGADYINASTSLKYATIYVGFEHECPHGHRFILTPEHLSELGGLYAMPEESFGLPEENSDHKLGDPSRIVRNAGHGKARRQLNGTVTTAAGKIKNLDRSRERMSNSKANVDRQMQYSGPSKEIINVTDLSPSMKDIEAGLQSVNYEESGFPLLGRNIPIYMCCPHCKDLQIKDLTNVKFAGSISQLQRIFIVTPPFPVVLASCPVIQFDASCLPPSVSYCEKRLQFGFGCQVILPPESFLSLKLPFIYGLQLDDGSFYALKPFENQPQLTAWVNQGTILQVVSKGNNLEEGVHR